MKRNRSLIATLALLLTAFAGLSHAQSFSSHDSEGIWTFFVTFSGAPPCQCIELGTLHSDGTYAGPGNDHFSGPVLGLWKQTGFREITFSLLENNFNQDGTAGGVYVIKFVLTLNQSSTQGAGSGVAQIINNDGTAGPPVNFTIKATKLTI